MDDLTRSLLAIVSDPDQVALLYSHLRQCCHDTRNELSVYRMKLYMARRDTEAALRTCDLAIAESRYRDLERFVVTIQTICRPMNPTPMPVALDVILDDCRRRWVEGLRRGERILAWSSSIRSIEAHIDFLLLGEALDAFVTWRAESGTGEGAISVAWSQSGEDLKLSWRECGVNLRTPGKALPNLALVLLGRVVAAHRGKMTVDDRDGLNVEITLPLQAQTAHTLTSVEHAPVISRDLDPPRSWATSTTRRTADNPPPRTPAPIRHTDHGHLALSRPFHREGGVGPELD